MSLLFLDTETNAKLLRDQPYDDPGQPQIVQLGILLTDDDGHDRAAFKTLIKPDGWAMSPEAQEIHGISIEDCIAYGIPIQTALTTLGVFISRGVNTLIAHNVEFDETVVRIECKRYDHPQVLNTIPVRFCTMQRATRWCKLPGRFKGQHKWPKLEEAFEILCGRKLEGAHDAFADVTACRDIYLRVRELEKEAGIQITHTKHTEVS